MLVGSLFVGIPCNKRDSCGSDYDLIVFTMENAVVFAIESAVVFAIENAFVFAIVSLVPVQSSRQQSCSHGVALSSCCPVNALKLAFNYTLRFACSVDTFNSLEMLILRQYGSLVMLLLRLH